MHWTAFYVDNVIRSEDLTWGEIPDGVVLVVERQKGRRNFWHGDWIWLYNGKFGRVPGSAVGEPWSEKPEVPCVSCVKKGALVSDEQYALIQDQAYKEKPL